MTPHNRPFVYVAGPYSDKDPVVREERFHQHAVAAAWLVQHGHVVYAPIVHCHSIAVAGGIKGGWDFWQNMDMPFLALSRLMVILPLSGWLESKGLWHESQYALQNEIPITFMTGIDVLPGTERPQLTWSNHLFTQLHTMPNPESKNENKTLS